MNAFSKCFVSVRSAENHRQVLCKRYRSKIPEHIVTEVINVTDVNILIFMLLYSECTQRYNPKERIRYCNKDYTGVRSSSETQENKNGRKDRHQNVTKSAYSSGRIIHLRAYFAMKQTLAEFSSQKIEYQRCFYNPAEHLW